MPAVPSTSQTHQQLCIEEHGAMGHGNPKVHSGHWPWPKSDFHFVRSPSGSWRHWRIENLQLPSWSCFQAPVRPNLRSSLRSIVGRVSPSGRLRHLMPDCADCTLKGLLKAAIGFRIRRQQAFRSDLASCCTLPRSSNRHFRTGSVLQGKGWAGWGRGAC